MSRDSFHAGGMCTPMRFGGTNVPEMVLQRQVSIFRPPQEQAPRVNLPAENPKYPETKHTLKCVVHRRECVLSALSICLLFGVSFATR